MVKVSPGTKVMDALSEATGNTTNNLVFAHNGEQSFYGDNVRGDIVNKPWDMFCVVPTFNERFSAFEDRMKAQDDRIKVLEDRIQVLEGTALFDWFRNVASTVLLFFAGSQPHKDSTSHRFYSAEGEFLNRMTDYVDASSMWEIKKFKKVADDIISRRNAAMHPICVEDLDTLVDSAHDAMQRCRRIPDELKQEATIIADYESIKKHYPDIGDMTVKEES